MQLNQLKTGKEYVYYWWDENEKGKPDDSSPSTILFLPDCDVIADKWVKR